jgi:hypothetical protein
MSSTAVSVFLVGIRKPIVAVGMDTDYIVVEEAALVVGMDTDYIVVEEAALAVE